MDATHFRHRAARARELAQTGDDVCLSQMLLQVALDMDAEAEAMEADGYIERRGFRRVSPREIFGAMLHRLGPDSDERPIQIINLSISGAKFRIDRILTLGVKVILELPSHALHLEGTVLRMHEMEASMVFDPASSLNPDLTRLLRLETVKDWVRLPEVVMNTDAQRDGVDLQLPCLNAE